MLTLLILIEIIYLINERLYPPYIYYVLICIYMNSSKTDTSSKDFPISKTTICPDEAPAKTPIYTDKVHSKAPMCTDKSHPKAPMCTDKSQIKTSICTDKSHSKAPMCTDKSYPKAPICTDEIPDTHNNVIIPKTLCDVPIILGEYVLEIPLEHSLKFQEKALKIRNIKNLVTINEYSILYEDKINYSKYHIFINGILTRNIEYSCYEDINDFYIKTSIKEIISQIPFQNVCWVQYPKHLVKGSNKIKLHLKKAIIEDINLSTKKELAAVPTTDSIADSIKNSNFSHNLYSIKELQSKILLKLQIDLIKNSEAYI